jgi:glutamine synthetase
MAGTTAILDRSKGLSAQHWQAPQFDAAEDVLRQITDHGTEAIRIVFADQHGVTRGKTVMAGALRSALQNGLGAPSTLLLKDSSHATVFPVWQDDAGLGKGVLTGAADILMLPDPGTFKILPWADKTGWMLADIYQADGQETGLSTRRILKDALGLLAARGQDFITGLEVEFTILEVTDPKRDHASGDFNHAPPETRLLSHGYQHLTEDRIDRLDDILTQLRRHAQALGMPVRSVEAEFGPSQVEFVFDPLPGLEAADMMTLFRNMVKQVCARQGLHATFMSRPAFKNAMGSGWHLHQSLVDMATGANLFQPAPDQALAPLASGWIAGLLAHANAGCVLSTPTVNGYKRYQPYALAPDRIQWGRDNRGAMLRVLCKPGDSASRIENRVGEPAANPYLYIASQILAGLDGVDRALIPPAPVERPYAEDADLLPRDLGSALQAFAASDFWRQALGDGIVDYLAHNKRAEWQRFLATVTEWEQREYFSTF